MDFISGSAVDKIILFFLISIVPSSSAGEKSSASHFRDKESNKSSNKSRLQFFTYRFDSAVEIPSVFTVWKLKESGEAEYMTKQINKSALRILRFLNIM